MPLPKPCNRCGKKFKPNTSVNKLCDSCREKAIKMTNRKPKIVPLKVSSNESYDITHPYKCLFCNERFRWKSSWRYHIKKEHNH